MECSTRSKRACRAWTGAGDAIAHDLRTPLTRVRVGLERGRQNARSVEELRAAVDHAIGCVAEIAGERANI
jgi:hypothetical protein